MYRIYPNNQYSLSLKDLRDMIPCKQLRLENSRYGYRQGHIILNWGNPKRPEWDMGGDVTWLNNYKNIANASNKVKFFQIMRDNNFNEAIESTGNRATAAEWLVAGDSVYCRTMISSREGRGIVVASTEEELVASKLYTRGVPKAYEYRAHVFKGKCFHLQQKKRKAETPDAPSEVKNHGNGWIFAHIDVREPPANYVEICSRTLELIELDFGAVDFLVKNGEVKIIEVNTAPGLTGTTLEKYAEVFNDYVAGAEQPKAEFRPWEDGELRPVMPQPELGPAPDWVQFDEGEPQREQVQWVVQPPVMPPPARPQRDYDAEMRQLQRKLRRMQQR